MTITTLSSSEGNHAPAKWAMASAQIILDLAPDLEPRKQIAGRQLQANAAEVLAHYFDATIRREADNLQSFPDHCDTPIDVEDNAQLAITQIQQLAHNTPWDSLIASEAWADAAFDTVAGHLAAAINVERLLHADRHPDNRAAQDYRKRIHG